MTKQIISILNKMNEENSRIKNCISEINKAQKALNGPELRIHTDYMKYDIEGKPDREAVHIVLKDEAMKVVLNRLIEHYTEQRKIHNDNLEELLRKLQGLKSEQ